MENKFSEYQKNVKFLESIRNLPADDYISSSKKQNIWLERFAYFLKLLDNPHKHLKYIHVAGTTGKGSLATMIHSILTEANYKTGLYTSPFSTTSIEKFKVNNKLISPQSFASLIERMKPAIDETYFRSSYGCPTYFEICTALAFLYFQQQKCDYVILEVGCGGRFDATNIIETSYISAINIIDLDHTDFLGNNIEKIAKQKAAIIKPRSNFFTTSKNKANVLKIFKNKCKNNNSRFNLISPPAKKYSLDLLGDHQQNNAELAAAVCKELNITEQKIKAGLKKTKLSCRFEIMQKKPIVILDGAHNNSKVDSTIKTIKDLTYKKLYLIMAVTEGKDLKFLKNLISIADKIYITRHESFHKKCTSPKSIAKLIKNLNFKKPCKVYLCPHKALNDSLKKAGPDDLILVTGSFYLAGELRKKWRPEDKILKERKI